MTNDEVWSAVVRWVKGKAGNVTTIKANQSGPAPTSPYVMVNFTGTVEVRDHHITVDYVETPVPNSQGEKIVTAAPVTEIEWRFSVHAYGPNPSDRLRPIISARKISQLMEPLLPGLLVHETSQIRDVPDWINNAWQPRAQMDVFIRGLIRDAQAIDTIDEYSFDIAQMPAE